MISNIGIGIARVVFFYEIDPVKKNLLISAHVLLTLGHQTLKEKRN